MPHIIFHTFTMVEYAFTPSHNNISTATHMVFSSSRSRHHRFQNSSPARQLRDFSSTPAAVAFCGNVRKSVLITNAGFQNLHEISIIPSTTFSHHFQVEFSHTATINMVNCVLQYSPHTTNTGMRRELLAQFHTTFAASTNACPLRPHVTIACGHHSYQPCLGTTQETLSLRHIS